MGRSIRAELYKMKHTVLPYMHIFSPLLYTMSVYLAYRYTGVRNFSANELTKNYLAILGSLIPVLIGFVTAKESDLESGAGHFQFVLAEGGFESQNISLETDCPLAMRGVFPFPCSLFLHCLTTESECLRCLS